MNIKEHIEAGHYLKDEKGRALVPTRDGRTFAVVLTDLPGALPIGGYCTDSNILSSHKAVGSDLFLLPPPPRKVKVEATMNRTADGWHVSRVTRSGKGSPYELLPPLPASIELTGEYEEPVVVTHRRLSSWLIAAFLAVGAIATTRGVRGAERDHVAGPHEITLYAPGKDYDAFGQTIRTISGAYGNKAECEQAIKAIRLKVRGAGCGVRGRSAMRWS